MRKLLNVRCCNAQCAWQFMRHARCTVALTHQRSNSMNEVLKVKQVAEILNTSPQSIRNQISRGREGVSVPPSFLLGTRRVWLREAVMNWLQTKASVGMPPKRKFGRPTKIEQLQRRGTLSASILQSDAVSQPRPSQDSSALARPIVGSQR